MSNEPRWLTAIDRKIGKLSIDINIMLRDYRRALEHEHDLEEEVKRLKKRLAAHEPYSDLPHMEISPLALPRSEKPKRKKPIESEDQQS